MASTDYKDMLNTARERFIEGDYETAEAMLQQVMLMNANIPEIYHILGTIYYDQSKFNKAIKHFKRALEVDPNFTDASIGLSIILNDLGRYDEAKEIFEQAQGRVGATQEKKADPFIEDRIAQKHLELGDLYFQSRLFAEALEQFSKALIVAPANPDIRLRIAECQIGLGDTARALRELKLLVSEQPNFLEGLLKLGSLLQATRRIPEAIEVYERVLMRDPQNSEARRHLEVIRRTDTTALF